MRAAEVRHVEQIPSDGEAHEQWYERPRDQESYANGNPGHRGYRALKERVCNTHALRWPPGRPCPDGLACFTVSSSTVIFKLITPTPLMLHDFSIASQGLYDRTIPSLLRRATSRATPSEKGRGA